MRNEFKFYLSIFLRRLHYFLLVAVVFTAAGIATAIVLPTRFTADAVLLVESPQIPDELAASTVQTSRREQLQIIEQRLLTRANLLEIASENDVYDDRAEVFSDVIVNRMREDTRLRISTGRDQASLFTISFEANRPITAEAVVNAYVTRVLEDNVQLRTERAEGTMEFFEQEVQRLGLDLSRKSAEILEFKNRNLDSLPENLDYQLARLDELRDRSTDASREIASLSSQRERLILIYNATGGTGQASGDLRSPEQRELDAAEDQLAQLLSVFSEQNPRVRSQRARIEVLREAVRSAESDISEGPEAETDATTLLDLQLAEIEDRQAQLAQELEVMQAEAAVLRTNVEAIPSNSVALDALERDYENIQQQYNQAVAAASAAATGERIELLSKGERITVLSQPTVPREPSSPNRPMIAAAGAVAGIAGGLSLVVLLELLNGSIRRPVDITRALGITPLATLPMMRTPREIALRRGLVVSVILVGCAVAFGGVFYAHTQIMPVDLIATRVIDRLGL